MTFGRLYQRGYNVVTGKSVTTDLNEYVTENAMTALFSEIKSQEDKIRSNPVERTTEILKKVFCLRGFKQVIKTLSEGAIRFANRTFFNSVFFLIAHQPCRRFSRFLFCAPFCICPLCAYFHFGSIRYTNHATRLALYRP